MAFFFGPDIGTEVPERVPATIYQFFGVPSMAFSAQTVGQKPLNEFLPPDVHFWGHIYGLFSAQTVGQKSLKDFLEPNVRFWGAQLWPYLPR